MRALLVKEFMILKKQWSDSNNEREFSTWDTVSVGE